MNMIKKPVVLATALTGMLFSGMALADRDDIRMLDEAKISLTQAIEVAEKHHNGRAFEAELDHDRFVPVYEVKVVAEGKVYKVDIDGVSGEIRKVKEKKH